MFMPFIPFSVRFAQWYRAKQFAEGKAEGKAEVRAKSIKLLKDRGFYAVAAALEAPALLALPFPAREGAGG